MTPLHLDVLMHYYTRRGGDYEMIPENRTRTDYAFELASLGLLYSERPEGKPTPLFTITEYGKRVFEDCLTTFGKASPQSK